MNKTTTQLCPHFGTCGGCSFQNIPYHVQLCQKEERIRQLLSSWGITAHAKPINHYQEWFYRNKMEFTFAYEKDIICGLHRKKMRGAVVDIEECLIFSPDAGKILPCVKQWAREQKLPVYNKSSHQGCLRHLIIRETKFKKQLMVGLVTTTTHPIDKKALVALLLQCRLHTPVTSIYWIGNDSFSDAVVFQKKELLYGKPFIEENLGGMRFAIGIDSFFQVNSSGIRDLYTKMKEYAQLTGGERVLDLYCGMGCIGSFLARRVKFVWGVEVEKAIVDAAYYNAHRNNIKNISFFVSDARRFLNSQGSFYKDTDILIINPPRCGLSQKIIRAILRITPKVIFYSSCNPDTQFKDIKALLPHYTLEFVEPFDFFPHTPHLECLAVLKRA